MSDVRSEAEEYAQYLEENGMLEPEKKPEQAEPDKPEAEKTEPEKAEPEKAEESEKTPADAGVSVSGDTKAEEEELFPGFNALSDDAKAAVKERLAQAEEARVKAEKQWKAQYGQLAPTQRELEQARREMATMREKLGKIEEAQAKGAPTTDLLKKFKEEYPAEGEALEAVSQTLSKKNEELNTQLAEVKQYIARQRAVEIVSQRHPDWQEIDSGDTFKEWLKAASPHKQGLARSTNPNDVAEVLDDYKRDLMLAQALAGQPTTVAATPAKAPKKPDVDPNPTQRQSVGVSASNAGSSEADEFAAVLTAAGYQL